MAVMILTDKSSSWDRIIHEGVMYSETRLEDIVQIDNDLKYRGLGYYAGHFFGVVENGILLQDLEPHVLLRFEKEWY